MPQLKEKHSNPQPTTLGSPLFGPINDDIPESVYSEINGEMIREAALRTVVYKTMRSDSHNDKDSMYNLYRPCNHRATGGKLIASPG